MTKKVLEGNVSTLITLAMLHVDDDYTRRDLANHFWVMSDFLTKEEIVDVVEKASTYKYLSSRQKELLTEELNNFLNQNKEL